MALRPKQVLESALNETFGNERTGPYRLDLAPGFTEHELNVRELEIRSPPLPDEIRELLRFTRGFRLGAAWIDFWCLDSFGLESVFPCGNAIGDPEGEGSGSFWMVDVNQRTGEWGPVFYAGHDPRVVVLYAATLADFLDQLIECHRERRDALARIETSITTLCRCKPCRQTVDVLRSSVDPIVRRFAETLPGGNWTWQLVDLRDRQVGDGLDVSAFGHDTVIRRFGSELLYALSPSAVRQRLGAFGWLLG